MLGQVVEQRHELFEQSLPSRAFWMAPAVACCNIAHLESSPRHFERNPILYALETDWPVGAQSLPKTFSAHHVPPRLADLAKVMELYQNDLNDAASIWSS